jgi:hypothetical protein
MTQNLPKFQDAEQIQPAVQPAVEPVKSKFAEYGKRGGRPKYQPTTKLRREIEAFASYGIPEEDIARVFDIPYSTMRKHYRAELEYGHLKANVQVAGFLFTAAKKGNVPAMMFWLRCRAKWQEARTSEDELGKKAAAVVAAQRPDNVSEFGRVLVARSKRKPDVGFEQSGLGGSADAWPVSHTGTTPQ